MSRKNTWKLKSKEILCIESVQPLIILETLDWSFKTGTIAYCQHKGLP